ncbi:hypothetical protein GCM10009117_22320 [Gangjinia marincola]|uniref:Uncharacterized protein n=1 Tax=Gangjinia marincola TaxID=578463 RepID=A0ABP3XUZ4_9FLAO
MESNKYLEDLSEIKELMNSSSRFISLSGLSGIMAGIYAILGAAIAFFYLLPHDGYLIINSWRFDMLIVVLFSILGLSVLTAYVLTRRKAKKNNEKFWNATTKRLLINFLVPLVTGGIYILIKLQSQQYGLTASLMLIFYGLALVNASKYTLGTIKYLGYGQIIIGLVCAAYPGYGLWFWIIGFGVFHIIYGAIMYRQEKN